jgi:hypothetical protein
MLGPMTSEAIPVEGEMISPMARALGEGFHDDEI